MWGQTFFETKRPSPYLARLWRAQDGRQLRWLRSPVPSASLKTPFKTLRFQCWTVFLFYIYRLKNCQITSYIIIKKLHPHKGGIIKEDDLRTWKGRPLLLDWCAHTDEANRIMKSQNSQIITPFFLCWNIFNVVIDLYLKIFYYLIIIQLIIIDRIFSLFTLLLQRKIFNHLIQFKRKYAIIFK